MKQNRMKKMTAVAAAMLMVAGMVHAGDAVDVERDGIDAGTDGATRVRTVRVKVNRTRGFTQPQQHEAARVAPAEQNEERSIVEIAYCHLTELIGLGSSGCAS